MSTTTVLPMHHKSILVLLANVSAALLANLHGRTAVRSMPFDRRDEAKW